MVDINKVFVVKSFCSCAYSVFCFGRCTLISHVLPVTLTHTHTHTHKHTHTHTHTYTHSLSLFPSLFQGIMCMYTVGNQKRSIHKIGVAAERTQLMSQIRNKICLILSVMK